MRRIKPELTGVPVLPSEHRVDILQRRSNSHYRSKTCNHQRWLPQYALARYGNPVMTDRFASEIVAVRLHPT
jgi:hypothetical protein